MRESQVTVIIPVFGDAYENVLQPVLRSAAAQTCAAEVILADASEHPAYRRICGLFPPVTRYLRMHTRCDFDLRPFNPAWLRNAAAAKASTRYMYFSDADVCFLGRSFLSDLLEWTRRTGTRVAHFPPIIRVFGEACDIQYENPVGSTARPQERPLFFRSSEGKLFPLTEGEVRSGDGRYVTSQSSWRWFREKRYRGRGYENHVWRSPFHYGGLLVDKECFDEVGGYCEDFFGWGCEDKDILWKLKTHYPCLDLSESSRVQLAHFEHQRPHFNRLSYERNAFLHQLRCGLGIDAAIARDRRALALWS